HIFPDIRLAPGNAVELVAETKNVLVRVEQEHGDHARVGFDESILDLAALFCTSVGITAEEVTQQNGRTRGLGIVPSGGAIAVADLELLAVRTVAGGDVLAISASHRDSVDRCAVALHRGM